MFLFNKIKRKILYTVIHWKSCVSYFNMSATYAATYPCSLYYWVWNIFLIDKSVFKCNEDRTIHRPLFIPTSNILYHLQTPATSLHWDQWPMCFSCAVKRTNVTEWCDAEFFQILSCLHLVFLTWWGMASIQDKEKYLFLIRIYRPGFESCPILLLCPTHTFSSCKFTVRLLCPTYCTRKQEDDAYPSYGLTLREKNNLPSNISSSSSTLHH